MRVCRWDVTYTPYSHEQFLEHYDSPEVAADAWNHAVPYKDATGNIQQVLVKLGCGCRWAVTDRISEESSVLSGMLCCDDDSPVLDLSGIVGSDCHPDVCDRVLDYLCGSDSSWWEGLDNAHSSFGALDVADRLGLQRLLQGIVKRPVHEQWMTNRTLVHRKQPLLHMNASGGMG